jgi:hypothetical protein
MMNTAFHLTQPNTPALLHTTVVSNETLYESID